jgi:hypothetical protein
VPLRQAYAVFASIAFCTDAFIIRRKYRYSAAERDIWQLERGKMDENYIVFLQA